MKIAFTGSRNATKVDVLKCISNQSFSVYGERVWLIGDCPTGADYIIKRFITDKTYVAFNYWYDEPYIEFRANWDKYDKTAGPIRNSEMVKQADALVACWNGKSKGTRNCINQALDNGIPIYVHIFEDDKR